MVEMVIHDNDIDSGILVVVMVIHNNDIDSGSPSGSDDYIR